jgi:Exo-beta-D-glucosaminidase Ig-fold domain/Glycosyl hydrolases family 2/F5/8 type C domain/Glycosyl hydrolases family 2, sugar binding domain
MKLLYSSKTPSIFSVYPNHFAAICFLVVLFSLSSAVGQETNRGIGIYPGNPKEDFSPTTRLDHQHYRNLALNRPAYQSSSYDYNLTAQLITDGIIESRIPDRVIVKTNSDGIVKRNEREWIIDRHPMTKKNLEGSSAWIQFEMSGESELPEIDSVDLSGNLLVDSLKAEPWIISISASDDGEEWNNLAAAEGNSLPGDSLSGFWKRFSPPNLRFFNYKFKLQTISLHRFYRVNLNSPNAKSWAIAEVALFRNGKRASIGGPYHFTSAWMSGGAKEEWVYVDLGAVCSFDKISLYWIMPAKSGIIQISNDADSWQDIIPLSQSGDLKKDYKLIGHAEGRYVRVLMKEPVSTAGYALSEIEVYGSGGPIAEAHSQPAVNPDGRLELAGGGWKLQRESLVKENGESISKPEYNYQNWITATVPGTVLVSYLNAGAIPDPDFGDNQLLISDSYFYSDFWYRDEFNVPDLYRGKRAFLNFDGINWKAEIFLNGVYIGRIDGAFIRGRLEITNLLVPGSKNVLAVRIKKNDSPGFIKEQTKLSHDANGGELGADNPTFHASVGWDWIPTIRGRNIGIWNKVYLSMSGAVTLEDPFVTTNLPLPDTSVAKIGIAVTLKNHSAGSSSGILRGKFGDVAFDFPVKLGASEIKTIKLDPSTNPSLIIKNPKLWWPNGYGKQNLYNVKLEFVSDVGEVSDSKSFKTGIRELSYSEVKGALRIWVNGRRLVGKGGNWGFPESMLRYRGREYDAAVRYHKEMNFTMIRNWVGQTGDDEFFDACDRFGITVWQDFWLANPLDGPDPVDNKMFMNNVEDFVKRIRNHPSLVLFCGRNEGNPPEAIDSAIRKLLPALDPELHYISSSSFGVVSGGGPYRAMPSKFYFEKRATEKLHSEIGMPNMVSYESLKRMIPDSALWPIGRIWGVHDFNLESAQYGFSFIKMIEDHFGKTENLKEWLSYAQWVNFEGYRAIFEAQSRYRMGALLWMSHPAWPSMVWQTYDYFLEPTAAYFGCMKACEPLHIQWNPLTDSIEVVNYSYPDCKGLKAIIEIINFDGTVKLQRTALIDSPEDRTILCFKVEYPAGLSSIHFIKLKLEKNNETISENLYWHAKNGESFKSIKELPKIKLASETEITKEGKRWLISTEVSNTTLYPALMVKLKIVGDRTGTRILPVIFSDNYFTLMPGERKKVRIEVAEEDSMGERPEVVNEGLNIE